MLTGLFTGVLAMSITGSMVIGVIVLLRLVLRNGPKWCVCLLWLAMLLRLLFPQTVEIPFSSKRSISSAELLVRSWQQTVMEDTVTLYSHTDGYAAGIAGGRQPLVHKASGAFYLLAGEDDGQIPDTAEVVLFPVLAKIWLGGTGIFLLWNLVHWLHLRQRLTGFLEFDHYRVSDHISTPFVLGLIRPRIYLPPGLDERSQTMVLAHEQCHIRRGDPWLKLLILAALGIHWFNPVVWLGCWTAIQDMELACDEAALRKLGPEHRSDYAQALLRLSVGRNLYARSMTCFGSGAVKQRILRVLNRKQGTPLRTAVCFLLCAAMLPVMVVDAAPPWPIRWADQIRASEIRGNVIPRIPESPGGMYTLRQKQVEQLVGFLENVQEDQITLLDDTPVIEGGSLELIAEGELYKLSLGYWQKNGRACLRMTHYGSPEDTWVLENVPLVTYVEHLFRHCTCSAITAKEITPDMILTDAYNLSCGNHVYVYQVYCQTCEIYSNQYLVRYPGPILPLNKRK